MSLICEPDVGRRERLSIFNYAFEPVSLIVIRIPDSRPVNYSSFKSDKVCMKIQNFQSIPWGVIPFDECTQGIPQNSLSVIETPDYHTGQVILGLYIYEGLKKGEKAALLTFDSASDFLENFFNWNIDFSEYLESEQLILLNYKGDIGNEIGLTHEYDALFEEVKRLSGNEMPSRVAVQHIDTLVNLNNIALMNQSSQKLSVATNSLEIQDMTVLGQFIQFNDNVHKELSVALQKTASGYFTLERPEEHKVQDYVFKTRKLPWFAYNHYPAKLKLNEGEGFQGGVDLDETA